MEPQEGGNQDSGGMGVKTAGFPRSAGNTLQYFRLSTMNIYYLLEIKVKNKAVLLNNQFT